MRSRKKNSRRSTARALVPFLVGLNSGTSYTLLVSAFNGYFSKVYAVEQTTAGKEDPMQQKYKFDDVKGEVSKDDLFNTTWNYYAVDAFDENDATNRQYLGKVTFSENADDPRLRQSQGTFVHLASNLDTKTTRSWQSTTESASPMPTCHIGMFKTYHVGNMFTIIFME